MKSVERAKLYTVMHVGYGPTLFCESNSHKVYVNTLVALV